MGSLLGASHLQAQIVLQALEAGEEEIPENTVITIPNGVRMYNGGHWIVSILDDEYLPFRDTDLEHEAKWSTNDFTPVGKVGKDNEINVRGRIPAKGISLNIPVDVDDIGSEVILPAYKAYAKTDAEAWVDRRPRILELSWKKQTLQPNTRGYISARLKVYKETKVSYITQLDLVKGLGDYYNGVPLAFFKMPKTGNKTTGYFVRVISGIPDKKFGVKTNLNSHSSYRHQFLYKPIVARDGKSIWLSNNLGADYTKLGSSSFDPNKQAGGDSTDPDVIKKDHKAYGSLFQWGREADGHELIDWERQVREYKYIPLENASSLKGYKSYRTGPHSTDNVCPDRFVVPTDAGLGNIHMITTGVPFKGGLERPGLGLKSFSPAMWNELTMRFTAAGLISYNQGDGITVENNGTVGGYWASVRDMDHYDYAEYMHIEKDVSFVTSSDMQVISPITYGYSIRCQKVFSMHDDALWNEYNYPY